jgi:DNA-binding LacI/PurR family transcriptional regulator
MMTNLVPVKHATIADVADRAGVSIATVSRVLNRTTRVRDKTAACVQKAIDELGFVPQAAARHLAAASFSSPSCAVSKPPRARQVSTC